MAHIDLPEELPGIRGPMAFRPETARPLNELAEILLRGPGSLSLADREMIAAHVSARNECRYCHSIHGAIAAHHLAGDERLVEQVKADPEAAAIPEKLKALLVIAGRVQQSGRSVTAQEIDRARSLGASDLEIHDTVLIAAMFAMCNRYVDGLATWAPEDPKFYRERAAKIAELGYVAATLAAPAAAAR